MSKDNVFLYDPKIIPWKTPLPEGMTWVSIGKPSILIANLGDLQRLNEEVGPYKIIASAATYLANISHMTPDEINEMKKGILYSGAIAIYKEDQIPGTRIQGHDLKKHGRIWTSKDTGKARGLQNLIFANALHPDRKIERIEAILAGYEAQEKSRHR